MSYDQGVAALAPGDDNVDDNTPPAEPGTPPSSEPPPDGPPPSPDDDYPGHLVRRGMRGPDVEAVQTRLVRAGLVLDVDGAFGPKTEAAVRTFQRDHGLAVDGVVGPLTWRALAGDSPARRRGSEMVEQGDETEVATPDRNVLANAFRRAAAIGDGPSEGVSAPELQPPGTQSRVVLTPEQLAMLLRTAKMIEAPADPKTLDIDRVFASLLAMIALAPASSGGEAANRSQVAVLDAIKAPLFDAMFAVADKGLAGKIQAFLTRVRAMRSFYASQLKGVRDEGDMPEQEPVSGMRQVMVGLALAQIGKVVAGDRNDTADGKPARTGWRPLSMYFETALGNDSYTEKVKSPPPSKSNHGIPSWCGIFATWAAICAGAPVSNWVLGTASGVAALPKWSLTPKPGDIVNKKEHQHFGIITWVGKLPANPKSHAALAQVPIRTVEGNVGIEGAIRTGSGTLGDWNQGVFSLDGSKAKGA